MIALERRRGFGGEGCNSRTVHKGSEVLARIAETGARIKAPILKAAAVPVTLVLLATGATGCGSRTLDYGCSNPQVDSMPVTGSPDYSAQIAYCPDQNTAKAYLVIQSNVTSAEFVGNDATKNGVTIKLPITKPPAIAELFYAGKDMQVITDDGRHIKEVDVK